MRDSLVLLATLVGVVAFLVVGGTLVWAVAESETSCREGTVRPVGVEDAVQTAGWEWSPLGVQCVVSRADGSVEQFVVTPW